MTRNPICIQPQTPVCDAARLMADNAIRRLPVVVSAQSDGLTLLGMLSATDLYRAYPADCNPFAANVPVISTTAEQVMSRTVLTTTPETPIEDAATLMRDRKIGALPVMRANRLIGLITESDIFRAFISILKADAGATRITFSISKDEDLFQLLADHARNGHVQLLSLMVSSKDGQSVCVARVVGEGAEKLIDDLWGSGHQVVNVLKGH